MKRKLCALLIAVMMAAGSGSVGAQSEEPTIYVVKQGDTLWGLSSRFLKDPNYWPNLWARNDPSVTNPHLIFPGQKLKVFPDRIVPVAPTGWVPAGPSARPVVAPSLPVHAEEVVPERTFQVEGGAGFILEKEVNPLGLIVATDQNRHLIGDHDFVYTDLGREKGAKSGDRFSIFKDMGPVSNPFTNVIMGNKVIPLGDLQLSEVEAKSSRANVIRSFREVETGSYLMPYRDRRREVALKASSRNLSGTIIDSQSGNSSSAAGDIVFLDIGTLQGVEVGNMLYIGREVEVDKLHLTGDVDKLPVEVAGALVVVETGWNTSTALIVKSIDAIYRGDRVELRKSK
jgi:LysM repeat protein